MQIANWFAFCQLGLLSLSCFFQLKWHAWELARCDQAHWTFVFELSHRSLHNWKPVYQISLWNLPVKADPSFESAFLKTKENFNKKKCDSWRLKGYKSSYKGELVTPKNVHDTPNGEELVETDKQTDRQTTFIWATFILRLPDTPSSDVISAGIRFWPSCLLSEELSLQCSIEGRRESDKDAALL